MEEIDVVSGKIVYFQTSRLNRNEFIQLARLALIIRKRYLTEGRWDIDLPNTRGSVTLSSADAVIKLFFDHEHALFKEVFGTQPNGLSTTVIGVDLVKFDPVVRKAIRDEMGVLFLDSDSYADPRGEVEGKAQVRIQPIMDHDYDVAWLAEGPCPDEVDEAKVDQLVKEKWSTDLD